MYLDEEQREELEPSITMQLDLVGRQPHSREWLEHEMNTERGDQRFELLTGLMPYHPAGIQFTDLP